MAYQGEPSVQDLASAVAMDPQLKQNAVSRWFETASGQHNALKQFTSVVDPKTMMNGGPRSIFAEKTDLKTGGAQTVNFNTIGIPGGPGVQGDTQLSGNTSRSLMATYPITVDWVRDGVEMTIDEVEFIAAGRNLEQVTMELLAEKMGLVKQNHQLKRLIDGADGNTYRPNDRASIDELVATDTFSLDVCTNARARLQTLGGKPLVRKLGANGSPVDGYMMFSTNIGMLPVRNDSSFQTAISNGDERGANNANFTGELLNWQGNSFYELPVTDLDWDDFKGGPLLAKATLGTACQGSDAAPKLITNAANTKSLYYQWFGGYAFNFSRPEFAATPGWVRNFATGIYGPDTNTYYAWIINPDGSRGFVSYLGASGNNGNQITIDKVLSPKAAAGKRATTVGALVTSGVTNQWTGGASTLPVSGPNGAWNYTDIFVQDAVIIQANRRGVPYTRSFALASMAACFAHGRIKMSPIKQDRDFEFTIGRGYQMIFGTGVCKNARKKPAGYILVEHAIDIPGYPVPSV